MKKRTSWKLKAYEKVSKRERLKREGVMEFRNRQTGYKAFMLDRKIDRFIRENSCRHRKPLGKPCASFDIGLNGACRHDGRVCDLLTDKGERYRREYE